ncbi:MAG: Mur ligase family protein, partial [Burkholderiales bacterium]
MNRTPLLADTPAALHWLRQQVRGTLRVDSRSIQPGDGFIAWPGAATDGRRFVGDALARGAAACLVEDLGSESFDLPAQGVALLRDLKRACGPLASAWHGEPSQGLDVLAVTGTNGKTSTAWWLAQALNAHGGSGSCGLVGTLGMGLPQRSGQTAGQAAGQTAGQAPAQVLADTGMTTPDPMRLQQHFAELVRQGASACAIEASSIGLAERRLDGTRIRTAIFTNFTQDHLDYHGSMQAYWQAKAELFAWPGLRTAVVNVDDPQGALLAQDAAARGLEVWTCSQHQAARVQAVDLEMGTQGLSFTVQEGGLQ